jgi:hypothetical protein
MAIVRMLALTVALLLVALIDPRPAQAQWGWPQGPWCAYYSGGSGTDCGYFSFAQCRATIYGVGGYCGPNPNYVLPPDGPRRYRKRRPY